MAWTPFDPAKPVVSGTRQAELDATRANLLALRAMLAAGGSPYGWNRTQAGADIAKPTSETYANGVLRLRVTYTWGTTGGAAGNVTKEVYEYSDTSGSSYEPLDDESGNYVATYTYDATRPICTTNTWGATP